MTTTTRLFLNIETTGLHPQHHSILELTAILRGPTGVVDVLSAPVWYSQSDLGNAVERCHPVNLPRLLRHIGDQSKARKPEELRARLAALLDQHGDKVTVVGFNAEKLDLPFLHESGILNRDRVHHRTIQCGQLFMRADDPVMPDTLETVKRARTLANVWNRYERVKRFDRFLETRGAISDHSSLDDAQVSRDVYETWEAVPE